MLIVVKAIYRISEVPVEIPTTFFAEIEKSTLKFIWNCKGPQITKIIFKKNKIG